MISRDMLYALLLGLPEKYFAHLGQPWPLLARRVHIALGQGLGPVAALRQAFAHTGSAERAGLRQTLEHLLAVAQIPGLSYRQREALVALRTAKSASLSQLCAILGQDRRNTQRRLKALVDKGLAYKFYQPNGAHYFAIIAPLDREVRHSINAFLDEMLRYLTEQSIQPTQSTQPTPSTPSTRSP